MYSELFDQWVAVQVRSRSEQMVELLLRQKGYEVWVPCWPKSRSGRRRQEPLFPGYAFCRFNRHSHGPVVTTPGVLRFVGPGGRPQPVPISEIAAVQKVVDSGLPFSSAAMQPGCRVEVVAGPLKGCCGAVVGPKADGVLVVGISLLQRAVSVAVNTEWLWPAPVKADVAKCGPIAAGLPRIRAAAC